MIKTTEIDEQDFKQTLTSILSESQRPPFLFVGSGMSIRYYSIPTWMNLLKAFVDNNRDCFQYEFGYYSSKSTNDPLKIAANLAEEFHEHWWKSEKFVKSRKLHQKISGLNTEIAFKIELSNFVENSISLNEGLQDEINTLSKAVLSGILTTNWDNFIQSTFPDFQVQIGQKEAIFADHKSIGELFKIHGCISTPESLVVTSNDYDKFIENNHYLNAKLLTLFAEYPIIFVGYSLSDINIELILKNLSACLDKELFHIDKLRNRLFFVEWNSEKIKPKLEHSTYTLSSITIPLIKITVHDFTDLWNILAELPRTLSVKTLRHLQNMIFEFVTSTDPTGKVLVNGIDELDKIENLEVVVGFGNISKLQDKGIIGLKSIDLLLDILFDDIPKQNYKEIVEKLLPTLIKQNTFIPFFKYQKNCKNLNSDNSLKSHIGDNFTLTRSNSITIDDYRVSKSQARMLRLVKKYNSLQELIDDSTTVHAVQWIPYLKQNKINIEVLEMFLKKHWSLFIEGEEKNYASQFRKCICLLDYLKYANHTNNTTDKK